VKDLYELKRNQNIRKRHFEKQKDEGSAEHKKKTERLDYIQQKLQRI
jgi:hypothetical protein